MMAEMVELQWPPACIEAGWKLWNSLWKVWLGSLIPVRNQTASSGRLGFVSRCVWAMTVFRFQGGAEAEKQTPTRHRFVV